VANTSLIDSDHESRRYNIIHVAGLMPVRSGNDEHGELRCCIAVGEISHAAATNFNQKM
jgi:hypothetical protein